MFRTTQNIEHNIDKMAKILNFQDMPKWYTLRFAIFISLTIERTIKINLDEKIDFENGIGYKAEVITGRNKTDIKGVQGDYTDLIAVMVSNAHNCKIEDINSLNEKSSIFLWLKNEFKL